MNRNQESHFSRVPTMQHPRSSMDRSCGHTTSFNAGKLIPIYCEDVLPGDTVSMNTSVLARLQTMLTPAYGNIYLDTYWFFVPNRLTWNHWKEFMGENTQSSWYPKTEYTVPVVYPPAAYTGVEGARTGIKMASFPKGSVADYLGMNILDADKVADYLTVHADGSFKIKDGVSLNGLPVALPLRAYGLIWNDFFRDQNLQDPVFVSTSDASTFANVTQYSGDSRDPAVGAKYALDNDRWNYAVAGLTPFPVAKFHDYFTSCLPAPQKGPASTVPVTGQIPVITGKEHNLVPMNPNATAGNYPFVPMTFANWAKNTSGVWTPSYTRYVLSNQYDSAQTGFLQVNTASEPGNGYPGDVGTTTGISPSNLWASFSAASQYDYLGAGMSFTINDLRLAVCTQMYYEALARGGSRYEEQIQQFFGVTNPDSRIQHPEYLGGRRMQINVREVTNTAQSSTDFLGDVGAQSVTAGTNSDFTKSFTEHGWLMGFVVVRYDHSYNQGMPRKFTRRNKFDFYNPIFARIGEQPVYDYEIYNNAAARNNGDATVFGYQEAWATYRYAIDQVSGEIRPSVDAGLGHWTLSDNYASKPTLSSNWIVEDKSNLDRVLAVQSTLSDQIFADFFFNTTWTRPMPMYSVPGAIGAF